MMRRYQRREFLAAAAGSAAVGFGQNSILRPSDKMNVAFIGIAGGYGNRALEELSNQTIVAICDVDWRTREQQNARFITPVEVAARHPNTRRFDDWRQMLQEMDKGIDAIVVCTPDHTHAIAAITAMKMGKHVFCEKPLAHTVDEVRAMMAAERKYKVATQTGIQGHASEDLRNLVEWVRDGAIGDVKEVHLFEGARPQPTVGTPPPANRPGGSSIYESIAHIDDDIPVAPEVKWDLWLGPARYRRYNPMYLPVRWRSWLDFGTGVLGDHGPHFIDPAYWALDLGYPDTIEADTDPEYDVSKNTQTFPRMAIVRYAFPARVAKPPVTLTWHANHMPPLPRFVKADDKFPTGGGMLIGTRGAIVYGPIYNGKPGTTVPGLVRLLPEELDRSYQRPSKSLPRPQSHWLEWVECAKAGTQPSADFAYGGMITQVALLGDIAIRNKGTLLRFDSKAGRFTNDDAANEAFKSFSRPGWALPV